MTDKARRYSIHLARRARRPGGSSWLVGALSAAALLCTTLGTALAASQGTASAAAGSGKPITSADQEVKGCPVTGGTLTVDLTEQVLPDLDPGYTPEAVAYRVIRGVFDSLVYENTKGQFLPWLATKWTANSTDTSYTFTLRQGVKFSDGTPFNATAVKFTFDRIESPTEGSLFAISLLGPYADSVVNSPYSVTVNFKSPYPSFLEAASQAFLGIVSPTAVAAEGATFGTKPVGSGPFVITSNVANQEITEVRNPDYDWGPEGLPHQGAACLSGIDFIEVPQASTRWGQLEKGQIDAAEAILPPDYESALSDSSIKLYDVPGAGLGYQYFINTQDPPWNDEQLRVALRDAIDLPAILKAVYQGEYTQAWSAIMPSTADYDSSLVNSWSYDPTKAKSILEAAGWKVGSDGYRQKDGKTLSITFLGSSPTRELRQEVATYIQSYLKAVGIKETITNYTGTTAITAEEAGDYGMTATSFITASPSILYDFFNSTEIPSPGKSGENISRVDNSTLDQWLATAETTSNAALAKKDWDLVQTYVVTDVDTIPIELEPYILATTDSVHGLTFDRRDYPIYYGVWLSK
jgi:peptide/nickel transport system substrate-binding protein